MTEKEQQSTSQPSQTQSFHDHREDEISLVDLLEVLIRKKVLVLATTSICTIFSIFYAASLIPTYQATIAFMEPRETFQTSLPTEVTKHLPGGTVGVGAGVGVGIEKTPTITNPTTFTIFLSKVMSYQFKKTVFENGNFFEKFYSKNNTTDIDNAVLSIQNSISLSKEKPSAEMPYFEKPITLKMTGTKPKAMSEYLTALTESAKQATIKEIKDLTSLIIKNEISKVFREINFIRAAEKEKIIRDRTTFSEALSTARNMGIKNNNFDKLRNNNVTIGVSSKGRTSLDLRSMALESILESQEQATIKVQDTTLPIWFLYGEKALIQELDAINIREKGEPIPGINLKTISMEKYKNIDPSSLKIKVITISHPSIPPATPIKSNKQRIIAIGVIVGLVIGIFMAFIGNSMDQLRKKRLSTTLTDD